MLIRRNTGWELRESVATPEIVFWRRRELLKAMGLASLLMPGLVAPLGAAMRPQGRPRRSVG